MLSAAPVTIYTSQEIFYNMDPSLFENSVKPKTVFQMAWPLEDISKELSEQNMNKTDIHDNWNIHQINLYISIVSNALVGFYLTTSSKFKQ